MSTNTIESTVAAAPRPDGLECLPAAARFLRYVAEREAVRERGDPAPWTDDPIIGRYRFCCVKREHNRVTMWIAQNWRGCRPASHHR